MRRISKSKGNVYEIDYTPDISPSGDRILYATSRHGGSLWDNNRGHNFEIETMDLKGEDRKRLTENRWNDRLPRWTPDGEHIAFLGVSPHDPGSRGIIVMNADGSDARLLVPLTVPNPADERDYRYFAVRWFAWSPNGDALALSLVDLNFPQVEFLEVASSDGSDPRRIFATPAKEIQGNLRPVEFGEILRDPAWSPDGSRLAFLYHHTDYSQNDFDGCGNKNPGTYLCIVDADGSGLSGIRLFPDRSSDATSFSWSPDGRRVLFTDFRESGLRIYNNRWVWGRTDESFRESVGEIYIKSLVLQRRFLHLATFGQFLAGNRFAEGKTTKLSSAWAGRHEQVLKGPFLRTVAVILDVITGDSKTVVPGAYASWSPDGSRIAVLGKYDDGGYLAIVAPDGSDFRVLVRADEDGDLKLTDD